MLQCRDGSVYTGITTNLARREGQHNSKKGAKSLYGKLPVKIVYTEKHISHVSAAKREIEIKGWNHRKKVSLIDEGVSPRSGATRGYSSTGRAIAS